MHGRGRDKYDNVRIGMNGRLDTIQAAVLLKKLTIFDDELECRRSAAAAYSRTLSELVGLPEGRASAISAWAQYTITVPEGLDRQHFVEAAAAHGVPTAVYYSRPLHLQKAYSRYQLAPDSLPVTEDLCRRVLSLPLHPYHHGR